MTTPRSRTLSKTDLSTYRNGAISRVFDKGFGASEVTNVFGIATRQAQRLRKKWADGEDPAPG